MNEPLKILFKFPCRGREKMFFESLDSLNDNIRDRNNYHIAITLDNDDEILNREEVIQRLSQYPNKSITFGFSESKIHAINRDFPEYPFDVIICWSNDMFATFYGFDDVMREYIYHLINNHGEELLVHFPEPDSGQALNVLYVATEPYFRKFGYIYHPSYKSLWADNESYDVAKLLGKYHYVGINGLYVHKNAAYHQYNLERDALFNEQQSYWTIDEENYKARKARNFDLNI